MGGRAFIFPQNWGDSSIGGKTLFWNRPSVRGPPRGFYYILGVQNGAISQGASEDLYMGGKGLLHLKKRLHTK